MTLQESGVNHTRCGVCLGAFFVSVAFGPSVQSTDIRTALPQFPVSCAGFWDRDGGHGGLMQQAFNRIE